MRTIRKIELKALEATAIVTERSEMANSRLLDLRRRDMEAS